MPHGKRIKGNSTTWDHVRIQRYQSTLRLWKVTRAGRLIVIIRNVESRIYTSWLHSPKFVRIRFASTHLYVLLTEQLYCLTVCSFLFLCCLGFLLPYCSAETPLSSLVLNSWILWGKCLEFSDLKLQWHSFTIWLNSDPLSHKLGWSTTSGTGSLRGKEKAQHLYKLNWEEQKEMPNWRTLLLIIWDLTYAWFHCRRLHGTHQVDLWKDEVSKICL